MGMTEADNLLGNQAPANNNVAKVPPPPIDVAIRTLESDLASFALTGGTKPKAQMVSLEPSAYTASKNASGSLVRRFIVMIVALLVLAGIGYAGYRIYKSLTGAPAAQQGQDTTSAQVSVTKPPPPQVAPPAAIQVPTSTIPLPTADFTHQTFFRKPVDQALEFVLPSAGAAAGDLQTFSQRLSRLFNTANPKGSFFELRAQTTDTRPLSFGQFIYTVNAPILSQEFLSNTFVPDFTFFVYKDADGYWPGYILALQPNQVWLYASPEVAKLEKSPSLEVLFATFPGGRAGDFMDDKIESQPVRSLGFSNAAAHLTYGWMRNYLIISTSKEGFRQALGRL